MKGRRVGSEELAENCTLESPLLKVPFLKATDLAPKVKTDSQTKTLKLLKLQLICSRGG